MNVTLKNIVAFEDCLKLNDSYATYLTPEFEKHLKEYLSVFEQYRNNIQIIPNEKEWKALPFGAFATDNSWKWRRQSLSLLKKEIKNQTFQTALEIGAWNGWLTKHLALQSETVIAVDYFTATFDGISNINTFAENIHAVQCNLETIAEDFKPETFDLIVLNHCLSYMKNPTAYIQELIRLLKPSGKIISLGNTIYNNPENKINQNKALADEFQKQYGMPLYIAPVKGYLDKTDQEALTKTGFTIKPYPQKILQNTYAKINRSAPVYVSIIYK